MRKDRFLNTFLFIFLFLNFFLFDEIYGQVKIGEQIWMTSNLNISKFQNGDLIFEAKTKEQWIKASLDRKPAWCYFKNNSQNGIIYGKLYNWYAVNDPRGLAPKGWHIPTKGEWEELNSFLHDGSSNIICNSLKSKSGWKQYTYGGYEDGSDCSACNGTGKLWSKLSYKYVTCVYCYGSGGDRRYIKKIYLSGNGTNKSGFSAKPGSCRYEDGSFRDDIGTAAVWWSASEESEINAYSISVHNNCDYGMDESNDKGNGFSVRLIKGNKPKVTKYDNQIEEKRKQEQAEIKAKEEERKKKESELEKEKRERELEREKGKAEYEKKKREINEYRRKNETEEDKINRLEYERQMEEWTKKYMLQILDSGKIDGIFVSRQFEYKIEDAENYINKYLGGRWHYISENTFLNFVKSNRYYLTKHKIYVVKKENGELIGYYTTRNELGGFDLSIKQLTSFDKYTFIFSKEKN